MKKIFLPVYDKEKCVLFALGRNAIYAACLILGLKPGDEVLTPAFDCDGSLQPFKVLGCKLRFFRSDPFTFSVDVDDLREKITSGTKLIHIINHFGMPQPWSRLLSLRRETGIPILEDNAYSLFSKYEERLFGTFGDLSIFSLRKNLPLIDGGLLRINDPTYRFDLTMKNGRWVCLEEAYGLVNLLKTQLGYYKLPESLRRVLRKLYRREEPPPPLYSDAEKAYPDWPLRDSIGREFSSDLLRPISRLALLQLKKYSASDYREITAKKRQYYAWLAAQISSIKGLTVLWPTLPEGTVPFCLSFLVESKRDKFLASLREKYDVMAWPTLPRLVLDQLEWFPEVEFLGRRLLQLNLPSDRVMLPSFSRYLETFVQDTYNLAETLFEPSRHHATWMSSRGLPG